MLRKRNILRLAFTNLVNVFKIRMLLWVLTFPYIFSDTKFGKCFITTILDSQVSMSKT
jgi:hypothetical protein